MEIASDKHFSRLLLSNRFRLPGYFLLFISGLSGYFYFLGGKPQMFEVPVFAVLTAYFESRWFVVAQTNLLDEIAIVTGILGFLFVLFSKEKEESSFTLNARIRAFLYAVYISAFIFILFYLTVFGWPILVVAAVLAPLFLIIFIVLFRKYKKTPD